MPAPLFRDGGRDEVTILDYSEGKLDIRIGDVETSADDENRRLIVTVETAKTLVAGLVKVLKTKQDADGY